MLLQIGQWHDAVEYGGQVREITFRALCKSNVGPPDTAITERQHAVLSPDKKQLVRLLISCNNLIRFFLRHTFDIDFIVLLLSADMMY